MSEDRRLKDHQLDRLERMLIKCIEAQKVARKERRTRRDPFYEKLKILQHLQKKSQEAIRRAQSSHDDEG